MDKSGGHVRYCSHGCYVAHKMASSPSVAERIKKYSVKRESGCIEWIGATSKTGYAILNVGGRPTKVSRLVLGLGGAEPGMFACHRCDNPLCVNAEHLFAGTSKDNVGDSIRKGRFIRGETVGTSKLRSRDIKKIFAARLRNESMQSIAARFNVSSGAIAKVLHRKTWKHLPL